MAKDNDGLLVSAGLDIDTTLHNIAKDIKDKINPALKSEEYKVQLNAKLDDDVLSNIQRQISDMSKNLKLDLNIGNINNGGAGAITAINSELKAVQTQAVQTAIAIGEISKTDISNDTLDKVIKEFGVVKNISNEFRNNLKNSLLEFSNGVQSNNIDKVNIALQKTIDLLYEQQKTSKDIQKGTEEYIRIQEQIAEIKSEIGKGSPEVFLIPNKFKSELDYVCGSVQKANSLIKSLYTEFGKGAKYVYEDSDKILNATRNIVSVLDGSLYESWSKSQVGGGNHAKFLVEMSAKLNELNEKLFSTSKQFDILYSSMDKPKVDSYIKDTIIDLLQLNDVIKQSVNIIDNDLFLSKAFEKDFAMSKEVFEKNKVEIKNLLTDIQASWDSLDSVKYEQSLKRISDIIGTSLQLPKQEIETKLAQTLNLKDFLQGSDNIEHWFEETIVESEQAAQSLQNFGNAQNSTAQSIQQANELMGEQRSVIQGYTGAFANTDNVLQEAENHFKSLNDVISATAGYTGDAAGGVDKFTVSVQNKAGVFENFTYILQEVGDEERYVFSGFTGSDKGVVRQFEQIENAANKLTNKLKNCSVVFKDINAVNPIKGENHLNELNAEIEELKNADASTFASMQSDIDMQIEDLKRLAKSYQNAERFATELRPKDIETIKIDEGNKLETFITKIRESKVEMSAMQDDINNLKNSLANVGDDKNKLEEYLNILSNAQSKFKALKQQANFDFSMQSQLDNVNKALDLMPSKIAKATTNFERLKNAPAELSDKVQNLNTLFANVKTIDTTSDDGIKAKVEAYKQLEQALKEVIAETNSLKSAQSLDSAIQREANAAALYSERLKKLEQDILAYEKANTKAMKSGKTNTQGLTFAQEFDNLIAKVKAGNTPVNQLTAEFNKLKSEIKAMGLAGDTILSGLWGKIKKFSSWMGITMITASIAREIRGMFTEVAELDTALVDLRKTFQGTEQDLESFYYSANDVAKQLGVTTKEVINQASAWSRLGFNTKDAAIELSKVSSIFKSISPDMNAEKAQSTLTSVIKAFNIDVADAIEISDKINVVGNNFALSNIDAADALQRSAAAMAASNTSFERTLSLIVAGQEIQQDADVVGI